MGEYLLQKGLLRHEQLEEALAMQRRTGELLGCILLALGYIKRRELYRALSELWDMPFILLTDMPVETELVQRWPLEMALKHRALPLRRGQAGEIWVAVSDRPNEELERDLREHFGPVKLRYMVTTRWDVDWAVRRYYRGRILQRATYALYYRAPSESAYSVFTKTQFAILALASIGLVLALYFYTINTLIILNIIVNTFFFGAVTFKFAISLAGAWSEKWQPVTNAEVRALKEEELPRYTILVPVYKEANIIGLLMRNLARLDYPKDKLEILVLVEEDDPETLEAAKAANPPDTVRFVVVPDGVPKTKPRACNMGLLFATGEYLVIYDAEDRPDPDQLKKAVAAFRKGPENMVCVQAALNYFNWNENFLTKMFTLEYSYWFDYILPGLYQLDLPIPLGGTSNHFKTDKIRELDGWDPFNVTEDADLGIRAAMHGYTVGVINSTTYEEANSRTGNWIRQRSRWIKGYMQTALVHSRQPLKLLKRVGLKKFLGFFFLIGGTPLIFLFSPPLWLTFLYWLLTKTTLLEQYFPTWVLYISIFNLLWGNSIAIYLNMLAIFKRRLYRLLPYALLNPAYWVLHSIAAYKALGQLFSKPFYWEKTVHGLTKVDASEAQ
ncbi:glycosyltransferase family 2 protein [Oceanithermus sp.]